MNKNVYSVSQINNYIKLLLEEDVLLKDIYIEGEISNFKRHTSGHLYFTIKDELSSLNAIMYSSIASNVKFEISNGMKVTALGYVSSYLKTGQYQFYIKNIEILGKGNLQKEFEILKEKLFKEGFFSEQNKKPIPKLPKNIGVITSQTGAAIKDIINVYKRRNKSANLILIPALVQGEKAPLDIIKAIEIANRYKKLDTIILARGGGAYEDLHCFNNEDVAKAIFNSKIPIITGIGHEIDFTIADFVSDFRAPTPSAAIEIALPENDVLKEKVIRNYYRINQIMNQMIEKNAMRLEFNKQKSSFKNFLNLIVNYEIFIENKMNFFEKEFKNKFKEEYIKLNNIIEKIELSSPTSILKKGYSFISNEEGKGIKKAEELKTGDTININFYDGEKKAKIF